MGNWVSEVVGSNQDIPILKMGCCRTEQRETDLTHPNLCQARFPAEQPAFFRHCTLTTTYLNTNWHFEHPATEKRNSS